jgi:hypothetical protein
MILNNLKEKKCHGKAFSIEAFLYTYTHKFGNSILRGPRRSRLLKNVKVSPLFVPLYLLNYQSIVTIFLNKDYLYIRDYIYIN